MNYQQTIDYLYNTLPMFSRMGSAAFKKDLTNTLLLCERLGNPHKKFKSIHVAGTNGKGSVSHMLAAVFQTSGYKTGLYTSPHLYDFRERIRVNGMMCDKDFIIGFVERIKPAIAEIEPSFFEITVAMAFDYFVKQEVDIAIIEVGLGGRLDSTNVITPELSVITNIGWDHMNMLGNTLEEIAFEKAGIIKPNVPVVIGEKKKETEDVFRKIAAERNAPIYFAQENFSVTDYTLRNDSITVSVAHDASKISRYQLDLAGIYQTKNILSVLQAIELLPEWNIRQENIETAFKNVKKLTGLAGRWEVIHEEPTVILEVAHNKNGMEQMLLHLQNTRYADLHIVLGMVKDKDPSQVLELLPTSAHYYFTNAHIPRALDAQGLQAIASGFTLAGEWYGDVNLALQDALANASKEDLVVVCGSIFLVAEVNKELITQQA
ncbi:MAG: bifunctional folylpolyglutamate synthase/dihydrofolate synthase [Flavisolibacter sp.]